MKHAPDRRYRDRFPAAIISQAVWLYHAFGLSLRDVELLLAERGIVVSRHAVALVEHASRRIVGRAPQTMWRLARRRTRAAEGY